MSRARAASLSQQAPQVPGVVRRGSTFSDDDIEVTPKTVSRAKCRRLACNWGDPHVSTCTRLPIMDKCSTGDCTQMDKHRYDPPCPKYQFYCNCKRDKDGKYKFYDNLPQVIKISNKVPGGKRDDSVMEDKSVCMRLLYRVKTNEIPDPRLLCVEYPMKDMDKLSSYRAKGWGGNQLVSTWADILKVRVSSKTNPHVVVESDDDDDITVCEQTIGIVEVH
jgi:hypothetical protein